MRTRAWRRSQNARLKKNRKNYWGLGASGEWVGDSENVPRRLGILLATPKVCSCHMCGNPRKYCKGSEQLSIQERRETQKGLPCDCDLKEQSHEQNVPPEER